jgi:hypothetical protein
MRPAVAELPGTDLLRWMDLLANDMITAGYTQMIPDGDVRAPIARCHALLWRGVLTRREGIGTFRRELSRLAHAAGLDERHLDYINCQVMAELMETVAARYSRSPREASRLSYEVARAACQIAAERPSPPVAPPHGRTQGAADTLVQRLVLAKQGA